MKNLMLNQTNSGAVSLRSTAQLLQLLFPFFKIIVQITCSDTSYAIKRKTINGFLINFGIGNFSIFFLVEDQSWAFIELVLGRVLYTIATFFLDELPCYERVRYALASDCGDDEVSAAGIQSRKAR